ncbi:hypothetical protein B296_00045554, partial [Ensete ventricosum]
MGGTYRSVRLPVHGPPAIGRFRQKSIVGGRLREKSTVDGRLREKSTVGGRLREKKGRRRGKEEEKKKRSTYFPVLSSLACCRRAPSLPTGRQRPCAVAPYAGEKGRGD